MNDIEKQVKEFINKLEKNVKNVNNATNKGIGKCCLIVQQEIIEGMTNTKVNNEKSYYTHNKKIPHHPSMPNEYPAIDSGTMRRSIAVKVTEENGKTIGRVGSTIKDPPYPFYLEFGTSKMQPRPWLKPSLQKAQGKFKKIMLQEIKTEIEK